MARINLSSHYKFRRLARAVGSRAVARGTLELLWESAYEAVSPFIGTVEDIAAAVDWSGDPAQLINMLTNCGFLDEVAPCRFEVHNLWKNCPNYVRLRWTRQHPGADPPWHHKSKIIRSKFLHLPAPPRPASTERTAASPRVLARLCHELEDADFESEGDLREALKQLAARYRVPYDAASLARALEVVARSRRPVWVDSLARGARKREEVG